MGITSFPHFDHGPSPRPLHCASHVLYPKKSSHNMSSLRVYALANFHITLNKKIVKVGHVGIKGGSSLVNHLVD